ncbi:helix-turn-helix domain-containing protein [Streptomyces phaeochromogenes]|uniref:helix-turn-helix domain-containing protein n=1 Tax=Streptomyces phaeochromogenes TaxID=1923 RepID=UPI002E291D75|nr:helix-turn-helix domain-containing protein [Streptomyces phaeochromogenes]
MLTLGSLPPDLELAVVWPQKPAVHHSIRVNALVSVPLSPTLGSKTPRQLQAGALVLITGVVPLAIRGRAAASMQKLLQQMSLAGCAGLVVQVDPGAGQPFPQPIRDHSDVWVVPLLTTTASTERWAAADHAVQKERLVRAEQREAQLDALVHQLPAQLADPKALQRIADWLAQALDVQVLVSEPERVLAASPDTAAEHLAQAIIRQSVESGGHDGPTGPHTQLISLAPGSGTGTVLAVARRTPFGESDNRLLSHAAKLLGLVDQATRGYRAAGDASGAARIAAVDLLLSAEVDKARRVMVHLAPGLLEPDTARMFVIDTTPAQRDAAVRLCETALAGRALVVADPRDPRRILVIHPVRPGEEADTRAVNELTRLIRALGRRHSSLGGSGVYSLSRLAEALHEARTAQRFALRQPDGVALSVQSTNLVSLLPQDDAQRWAHQLLHPLMHNDAEWDQIRETLPTALAYPKHVAARRLELHRNTVTNHVRRAAQRLNMDLTTVTHRIAVGLALELVTQRELSRRPATAPGTAVPTLRELLAAPQVRDWADILLSPARADRRDLLATATAWLACDAHIDPTARALGLSAGTVRTHIRALGSHLSLDLDSLTGMRDLQFSLHATTGKPEITEPHRELCTAA